MAKSQDYSFLPTPRILTRGGLSIFLFVSFFLILSFGFVFVASTNAQSVYSSTGANKTDGWHDSESWSPNVTPESVSNANFVIGDDLKTYTKNNVTSDSFPSTNKLYVGYTYNDGALNPSDGYLCLRGVSNGAVSITIDQLFLGNGSINQEATRSAVTLDGCITVEGNGTILVSTYSPLSDDNRSLTFTGELKGTGNLLLKTENHNKANHFASLTIASSANEFTGAVTTDAGSVITLSGANALLNASSFTNNGSLTLSANQTLNNLSGSGTIDNGGQALTLNNTASTNTAFSGVISGTGAVTKTGAGTLTLSGANTYTGTTTISGGTLKLSGSGTLGSGAVTNNAALEFAHTGAQTFSNTISGTGVVTKTGSGTLTLSSGTNNSIGCDFVIDNGEVILSNAIGGNNRFAKTLTINTGGTLTCKAQDSMGYGGGAATYNIYGGTLSLDGKNETFQNKTVNMKGGIITSNGSGTTHAIGIFNNGTTFNAKAADNATATKPTISYVRAPINLRNSSNFNIKVDENAQLVFESEVLQDLNTAQPIVKLGPGVLTFSAANSYTAETKVSQGVLQLTGDAVETVNGKITVENNGTLEFNVAEGQTKELTVSEQNAIFSTGKVIKTGDGELKIDAADPGSIDAQSFVISSGRVDIKKYFNGQLEVKSGATFSPGNSVGSLTIDSQGIVVIGESTYGDGFILTEEGSELLMEIGGSSEDDNDVLIVQNGNILLGSGIIELAMTDDCTLGLGESFTAVLSAENSGEGLDILGHIQTSDFTDLKYVLLDSGTYSGLYAITGRRFNANEVPEPSTWALLALGICGLLYLRKQK